MAKVGEGDPRWIVSERTDGANVNSWHWEERDLSRHTHDQLKKAFEGLAITDAVKIEELSEISGDVTVAQRKSKMMCYFELKMTLKWSGYANAAATEDEEEKAVKGTMEVPEVDHDEFRNEYEVVVKCADRGKAADAVEAVVRSKGRAAVRDVLMRYFERLFEEYHIGQQLKSGTSMPPPPPPPSSSSDAKSAKSAGGGGAASAGSAASSFQWKMRWRVPQENLFNCLTDPQAASMYTRCPATVDAKAGGQFRYLNGVISGYFVDVQAPTLIKEQWRLGSWATGVHSSVVMQLTKEEPGVTLLEFAQSGIPDGQLQSVQEGWKANFFEAMKMVYGFSMEYI